MTIGETIPSLGLPEIELGAIAEKADPATGRGRTLERGRVLSDGQFPSEPVG